MNIVNFFVFLLYTTFIKTFASVSAGDCVQMGLMKAELLCSSCNKLDDYGLGDIKSDCLKCCQPDLISKVVKKYPKAVLEVCTCKFGAYPQIQAFIKSDRPLKFPNLHIKYVRGLDPIVKLIGNDGKVREILSITKWNTDTVQEFFEAHLEKLVN